MPNFAAWIDGVDLTQPLTEPVQTELRQALWDFEVIFLAADPHPGPACGAGGGVWPAVGRLVL